MSDVAGKLVEALAKRFGAIVARSMVQSAATRAGVDLHDVEPDNVTRLVDQLRLSVCVYIQDEKTQRACHEELDAALGRAPAASTRPQSETIVVAVNSEDDIVIARNTCWRLCSKIGLSQSLQVKVCTVVSELARNIVQYAKCGEITLHLIDRPREGIEVIAKDNGPGIQDLERILNADYQSKTGLGKGLRGTKTLMDEFRVQSLPGRGTTVAVRKYVQP